MTVKKRESAEAIQPKLGAKNYDKRDTSTEDRIAADTARYEALAREHGAD